MTANSHLLFFWGGRRKFRHWTCSHWSLLTAALLHESLIKTEESVSSEDRTTPLVLTLPSQFLKLSLCVSQAETTQADLSPEQQAHQQVTVQPYVPFNRHQQNYLYISTATNAVSLGERLSLQLSIVPSDPTHREFIRHITYLVRRGRHIHKIQ